MLKQKEPLISQSINHKFSPHRTWKWSRNFWCNWRWSKWRGFQFNIFRNIENQVFFLFLLSFQRENLYNRRRLTSPTSNPVLNSSCSMVHANAVLLELNLSPLHHWLMPKMFLVWEKQFAHLIWTCPLELCLNIALREGDWESVTKNKSRTNDVVPHLAKDCANESEMKWKCPKERKPLTIV